MKKVFLIVVIMLLPLVSNKNVFAKDLSNHIGISVYGGASLPTNGNNQNSVKATDWLSAGPQFGVGINYFITEGFGFEALYNYGYNEYKDKYKLGYKEPYISNNSFSIIGVYNFGHLLNESIISPIARAGAGLYYWRHFEEYGDKIIKINNEELKGTSFGFNIGLGVDFNIISNLTAGIIVDYNMYFPKDDKKFGKDFAEQGYLTPQLKVSYLLPLK